MVSCPTCPTVQKILNGFYCRYQSKDYKVFKAHIELQHKPKDGEPFACYMCVFETVKTHLWINHLKTIYRCAICGEKFHAHFGTLAQNKHRGLRDYQDHIREKHPEVNPLLIRSDDRVPDFSDPFEFSQSSESSESTESTESLESSESSESSDSLDSSDS